MEQKRTQVELEEKYFLPFGKLYIRMQELVYYLMLLWEKQIRYENLFRIKEHLMKGREEKRHRKRKKE